uniref:Uncharacterized protein n=1 Tax=Nelumbo nucifera TaxID=4432 RepID=A0A822XMP7_NELNU|nr:TPA_asm: hypothetical protein HUJ06_023010 [Nelumbo nucifera]
MGRGEEGTERRRGKKRKRGKKGKREEKRKGKKIKKRGFGAYKYIWRHPSADCRLEVSNERNDPSDFRINPTSVHFIHGRFLVWTGASSYRL